MPTRFFVRFLVAAAVFLATTQAFASGVYITEWMYSGTDGEFIEFTNLSGLGVDFTGWSYSDNARVPGAVPLSSFGLVAAGESVIITEADAAAFRTAWGLAASVKVLGGNTTNIGRSDEINLYDVGNNLVDRLTFGDQTFPGSIRTQNVSGRPLSSAALGTNDLSSWVLSYVGDEEGSFISTGGDIGSPGKTNVVPIPGAVWLLGTGLAGLIGLARRRRA
jgi:uncharacterized protein